MNIKQRPTGLNFAGNLKDILVESDTPVAFTLSCSGEDILTEKYTPDADNYIRIPLKNIVSQTLTLHLPEPNAFFTEQSEAVKLFNVTLNDTSFSFWAIKGGIDGDLSDFIYKNFHTWQPQTKQILHRQPEWLTYYGNAFLHVHAYFSDETEKDYTKETTGELTTIDVSYYRINNLFPDNIVAYYDVWMDEAEENDDGKVTMHRVTPIQRYLPVESDRAEVYIFENTLGGFDTLLCTGIRSRKLTTEPVVSTQLNETQNCLGKYAVTFKQNTGFIVSEAVSQWLYDFLISGQRYHLTEWGLRAIYWEDNEFEFNPEDLNNFEFEYRYSNEKPYNRVIRNNNALPPLLELPSGDNLFFLTPRLSEYPEAEIKNDLMLPVLHAYTGKWMRIAGASLKALAVSVDLIDNLISARTDAALTANMGRYLKSLIDSKASDWESITGKPTNFPTSWTNISDKPLVYPSNWSNIADKPTSFNPNTHTHNASDIQGLDLSAKFDKITWDKYFYEQNGNLYCRFNFVSEKGISAYGAGDEGSGGGGWDLIDNLTSTRTDAALTANMGRYLKNLFDGKASDWESITGKPTSFPTSWTNISAKPSVYPSNWSNIADKPTSFTPSSHNHSYLTSRGNITAFSGTYRDSVNGLSMIQAYNNGYPTNYGNVISLKGQGEGQLFIGWPGTSGVHADNYIRSRRDFSNASWSDWAKLWTSANFNPDTKLNASTYTASDILTKLKTVDGTDSGLDADLLDGYHRNNLYTGISNFIAAVGNEKSITVTGDAATYYPVVITGLSGKATPNIVCVFKNLNSVTPSSWAGNHSSGTSSCYYIYEYRSMTWDGNGGYIKTLRAWYGYAPVNAHVSSSTMINGGLIVWLRGGGSQYYISCNNPFTVNIYYSRTNLGNTTYPEWFEPRTTQGNGGIYSSVMLGYGNIEGSAKRFQTARTIWGQSFDGTANVSGALSGATTITASSTIAGMGLKSKNIRIECDNNGTSGIRTHEINDYASHLYLQYNTSNSLICCSGGGSVGIGRVPEYKLDVQGDVMARGWYRTTGGVGWYNQTYSGGIYMTDSTYVRIYGSKRFYVNNTEAFSILTEGGFTRQGYAGSGWGNGHGALNIAITNNSSQTPLIVAYRAGQSPAVTGANRLFSMELLNSGTTIYWVYGGTKKFEFTSTGNFLAVGEITARTASDKRLKENIKGFDGLSTIEKLRPVSFDWNDTARSLAGDKRQHGYGLIAQEVESIIPELTGPVYDKYLGVNYEGFIPFLISAVQQLSREIEKLKLRKKV